MESKKLFAKRFLSNAIWLAGIQGIAQVLPIFSIPYLVNSLGTYNFGSYAFFTSFTLYLNSIVNYGFDLTCSAEVIKNSENVKKISKIVFTTYFAKLFLVGLSILLGIVLLYYFPNLEAKLFIYCALQLFCYSFYFDWVFLGLQEVRIYALLNSIGKFISVSLIFFYVKTTSDLEIAILADTIGVIFASSLSLFLIFIYKKIVFYLPSVGEIYQVLKESFSIFIVRICTSIYANGNILILGLLKGNIEVGIYSSADRLITILLGASSIVTKSFYPLQVEIYVKNKTAYNKYFRKGLLSVGIIFLCLSMIIRFNSEFILLTLLKIKNPSTVSVFNVLIFTLAVFPLGPLTSNNFVLNGNQKKMLLPFFLLVILSIVFTYPMSFFYGAIGMAISNVIISVIFSFSIIFIDYKQNTKSNE